MTATKRAYHEFPGYTAQQCAALNGVACAGYKWGTGSDGGLVCVAAPNGDFRGCQLVGKAVDAGSEGGGSGRVGIP